MHRIANVGGSAGGLELATRLGDRLDKKKRAHITLVDRSPAQVRQPLLHEVAAGNLDIHSHQIEFATQVHWHYFTFVHGELTGLDRSAKLLRAGAVKCVCDKGEVLPAHTVKHDTLVMAPGGRMYFFGIPGAKDQAIELDSLKRAEPLRRRLLETCVRKRVIGETGTRERMWTLQLSEAAPRTRNFGRSMANATEPPAGAPRCTTRLLIRAVVCGSTATLTIASRARPTVVVYRCDHGLRASSERVRKRNPLPVC